jgi:arylsulfatase A-like enzyme
VKQDRLPRQALDRRKEDYIGKSREMHCFAQERRMWDNTFLVVSSDNGGPAGSANNWPLRGWKFSDLEGGVRVSQFITGGALPEARRGVVLDSYMHVTDWFVTLLAAAGLPSDATDGELR